MSRLLPNGLDDESCYDLQVAYMRPLFLMLILCVAVGGCATMPQSSPYTSTPGMTSAEQPRGPIMRLLDIPGDLFFRAFPIGKAIP
jgi:hypothetical protein